GPGPGDLRFETVLVRAVVQWPEVHEHDDHVLRRDPLLRRGVDLLLLGGHTSQIGVRLTVVVVADRVREVRHLDPATERTLPERRLPRECPWPLAPLFSSAPSPY